MKKNIKQTLSLVILSIIIMSTLVGCGGNEAKPAANADEPIVLKLATTQKSSDFEGGNPSAKGLEVFAEYVEKESGGKLKIQMFKDGQLAATNEEIIGGIKSGAFDLTNLAYGSWGEYTDCFMPMNIPYLFFNADVANKALDGKLGQSMSEEMKNDTGLIALSPLAIGFRHLTNSIRPVHTPQDMKGLKIRTMTDPFQIKGMEALGAQITPTAYSELFTALQQGMVDGQENPIANIYSSGMYEVQKYMTFTGHNYTFTELVINPEKLESLPKEYQDLLFEAGKVAKAASEEQLAKVEAEMLVKLEEYLEIYQPTVEEAKLFKEATMSVRKDVEGAIGSEYYNEIISEVEAIEKELGL